MQPLARLTTPSLAPSISSASILMAPKSLTTAAMLEQAIGEGYAATGSFRLISAASVGGVTQQIDLVAGLTQV